MSPSSRLLLQSEDIKIRLQVGYRRSSRPDLINLQTIFLGSIDPNIPIVTEVKGADHITRVSATDGYIIREYKVHLDAPEGVSHTQVIKDIVNKIASYSGGMLTTDFSELDALRIQDTYVKGTSIVGVADKVLEERLSMHNLSYSTSLGALKIYKEGFSTRTKVHEVSIGSGLLSIPKPTVLRAGRALSDPRSTKAYCYTSLLNPDLVPLDRVKLIHESVPARHSLIIDSVTHYGGYEENQWYSKVNAHFEFQEDPDKSISEAQQKNNQSEIKYFDLLTNP
jgi:hypothetical protein